VVVPCGGTKSFLTHFVPSLVYSNAQSGTSASQANANPTMGNCNCSSQDEVGIPRSSDDEQSDTESTMAVNGADSGAETETLVYVAPETLSTNESVWKALDINAMAGHPVEDCAICLDALKFVKDPDSTMAVVKLCGCGHCFHKGCIVQSQDKRSTCPTCRKPLTAPQGDMPSGTMTVGRTTSDCVGYEGSGSIVIRYDIARGVQTSYHPHPGVQHGSAHREAYLPDTLEGNQLLQRLKFAFTHGLTFTVGMSVSNGKDDSVTWSSILHKTSLSEGMYGFPDPYYIADCNTSLDELNVPETEDL
jgi:deltex